MQTKFRIGDKVVMRCGDSLWAPCTVVEVGDRRGSGHTTIYQLSHGDSIVWAWETELLGIRAPGGMFTPQ